MIRSLFAFLFVGFLSAEVVDQPPPKLSPLDLAVQELFMEHATEESLNKALEAAKKVEASPLVLLDARYFYASQKKNVPMMETLIPELEAAAVNFDAADAVNFGRADDYKALAQHLRAIVALEKNDQAAFKQSILEAIWLSPDNSTMFTEVIAEHRRKEELARLKADMQLALPQVVGEPANLTAILGDKKLIVLDFWATWCEPCMERMPAAVRENEWFLKKGIAFALVNTDREKQLEVVKKVKTKHPVDVPWILEPEEAPLSKSLFVDTIPHRLVLTPEGKVLFSGHPDDEAYLQAIKSVIPEIDAPVPLTEPAAE